MLGGFDAIETPEESNKELKKDALLRKDVQRSMILTYILALRLLSGGDTTGKRVFSNMYGKVNDSEEPEVHSQTTTRRVRPVTQSRPRTKSAINMLLQQRILPQTNYVLQMEIQET